MAERFRYDALQHAICVELGFCGSIVQNKPSHVDDFIPESGRVTAEQFARWVVQAEGMAPDDPSMAPHLKAITAAFIRHMGASVVDAAVLSWTD